MFYKCVTLHACFCLLLNRVVGIATSLLPIVFYCLYPSYVITSNKHSTDYCSNRKLSAESTERDTEEMAALRVNICLTPHTTLTTVSLLRLRSQCAVGIDSLCPPLPLPFCVSSFHTSFLFLLRSGWVPSAGLWPIVRYEMLRAEARKSIHSQQYPILWKCYSSPVQVAKRYLIYYLLF